MSFGDDTLEPPTILCQGTKFIVARWMYDANIQYMRENPYDYTSDDFVTGAGVAVLRSFEELNRLADEVMTDLKEFYDDDDPQANMLPIVWSWHIPDEPDGKPKRCICFRGDEELCTIHIELIDPIEPIRQEHS